MAIPIKSTKDMSRLEWLQLRKQGIGGSDAGAILGISRWKSPFNVYMDKIEPVVTEDEDNQSEAAYWGTELEDMVAREFTKRTGKKVRKKNQMLRHDEHEFMIANLDRDVVGEKAFLECKTVGAYGEKEWKDDEVPASYLTQVQHYMAVTGDEKCYMAVLIGGQKFIWKEIQRDQELIDMIIAAEKYFWENHVQKGIPPALDGSSAAEEFLKEKYAISDPEQTIELKSDYAKRIPNLLEIKARIKELQEKEKEIENNIKDEMKKAEVAYAPGFQITWKTSVQSRVDSTALKEKYPDIYKATLKEITQRKFSIKEIKGE